ncbi:MAG: hypothetical protein ACU0CT_12605 [Paracoccaceae bacterium]
MHSNSKEWRQSRRARRAAQQQETQPATCSDHLRHARLFEMIRQQDLATRALHRLHLLSDQAEAMPLPSPAALAASLMDQSASTTS